MKKILLMLFLASCASIQIPEVPGYGKDGVKVVEEITSVAGSSACAKYRWKDRGSMPKGGLEGLTLTYARSLCSLKDPFVQQVVKPVSSNDKDIFNHYAAEFKAAGLSVGSEQERLRAIYTLMLGFSMRESSGKHCCGIDQSSENYKNRANKPVSSSGAEAGMFQTSWNARATNSALPKLRIEYEAGNRGCQLGTYKQGARCGSTDAINWGEGEGVSFQRLSKECPAFGTEFAAITIRSLIHHYGPLKYKKAEVRAECGQMLSQVEALVISNPEVCGAL